MTCPHCLVAFHDDWKKTVVGSDKEFAYFVRSTVCPSCFRMVLAVDQAPATNPGLTYRTWLAYPKQASRAPLPAEVPDPYRQEYVEACNVLADSAKASAAVSRRCLQMVLRDVAKVKPSDLSKEIDEVLPKLPSHLAEAIDAIRNVGNMAAHPIKSTNTGEVVDVEPGIKGGSVSNVGKPAKLETGLVVNVPQFVNEGDVIRVSTSDGSYQERVNS